jgi:hypothetical protein
MKAVYLLLGASAMLGWLALPVEAAKTYQIVNGCSTPAPTSTARTAASTESKPRRSDSA